MEITPDCVVALTWRLKDSLGEELDMLEEPVEFLVGGNDLLEKIEQALQGHVAGARIELHLEPEEAFGDYDEMLVLLEPRSAFPADLEEGMAFDRTALPARESGQQPLPDALYTVTEIYPEHVVLDGNHPLAGIALRLSLKVERVREASDGERQRGSTGSGFFKLAEEARSEGGPTPRPASQDTPAKPRGPLH